MRPAIIWGFGQLGAALAATIRATGHFTLAAVIDHDPAAAARVAGAQPSGSAIPFHAALSDYAGPTPATLFHATTSAPLVVMEQVLSGLASGHAVVSAAEWLFHPWLRFGAAAARLDAAARRHGTQVIGCGINPGFSFDALPLLLARSVHDVRSIDILRVSDVGGIGPSDFAHLGFGLDATTFGMRVADGSIEGHMGFPESVAALAERLPLAIDRITDRLEPTLALRPLDLSFRTIQPGEVVGITQRATGWRAGKDVIRFTLDMFLDPAGYGRAPREEVEIEASRSFKVAMQPAAPPAAGAAAVMVQAAAALSGAQLGLVSLLDLPLGGHPVLDHLRAAVTRLDAGGLELAVHAHVGEPAG